MIVESYRQVENTPRAYSKEANILQHIGYIPSVSRARRYPLGNHLGYSAAYGSLSNNYQILHVSTARYGSTSIVNIKLSYYLSNYVTTVGAQPASQLIKFFILLQNFFSF